MFSIRKYKQPQKKETSALDALRQMQSQNQSGFTGLMTSTGNNVYLVIDMSISMQGEKFLQAKAGAMDFSRNAIAQGWRVGLIAFHDAADMMCELTTSEAKLAEAVSKLGIAGSTNMVAGLNHAARLLRSERGQRYIVLVTDGWSNDPVDTQLLGDNIKLEGMDIITLGTPDAHKEFLQQLASSDQLSSIVEDEQLCIGMTEIAGLLPYHEKR